MDPFYSAIDRLVYKRETPAMTLMQMTECAALPWGDQVGVVFDKT